MKVKRLSLESFEACVIRATCPVLVAFLCTACPLCQMRRSLLEELALHDGEVACVAHVDVQAAPELARQCGVQSWLTTLLFDGGSITHQFIGALPKPKFLPALERALFNRKPR